NGVDENILAPAFFSQAVGQAQNTEFGGAVIGLTEIAVDTGGGGRHADAPIPFLAHDRPRRVAHAHAAVEVHTLHDIPVGLGHFLKADVTQDAGIVDHDIYGAKRIQCGLHNGLAIFHRVVVGHRFATEGADFGHHGVGC